MNFSVIDSHHLEEEISFHRPEDPHNQVITLYNPAINVMTDLKRVSLVTIGPEELVDTANKKMQNRGVRMLIVVNAHEDIIGIITASDIMGEKPIKVAKEKSLKHNEICVNDIMNAQLEVFSIADISKAKVGDLVETLKTVQRQHAIVVDNQGVNNEPTVRGIISLSQIARQLGKNVNSFDLDEMIKVILA